MKTEASSFPLHKGDIEGWHLVVWSRLRNTASGMPDKYKRIGFYSASHSLAACIDDNDPFLEKFYDECCLYRLRKSGVVSS